MIQFAQGSNPGESGDEVGVVLELEGELARVRPHRRAVCDACGSATTCFPGEAGEAPLVEARNEAGARVGDIVTLSLSETRRLGASLLVFGLPVAATVAGTALGTTHAADPGGGAGVGALAGLAAGLLLVHFIGRLRTATESVRPVVREVLGHDPVAPAPHPRVEHP